MYEEHGENIDEFSLEEIREVIEKEAMAHSHFSELKLSNFEDLRVHISCTLPTVGEQSHWGNQRQPRRAAFI